MVATGVPANVVEASLQDSAGTENANGEPGLNTRATNYLPVACTVDGDPNMMTRGAQACTGLCSDEESGVETGSEEERREWTVAKNAARLKEMKHTGWEYIKVWDDPTYADIYDGLSADSVLAVAEDPLALLFYYLPPRFIHAKQRATGGDVEEIGDIRRLLADVQPVEPWDVLRVTAPLVARMLAPVRKGIAAH
ncbi:hypothetical protein F443_14925 [Phytophthora nicotianae P1569]|uniref:Uncharacterized protein n=1 Tax=Phytophthora nicotianae P1569 TaxID=1317065 RepID=V9ELX0_PHYNI|nr:hypothetical protein F443_14925 [Phytophthora nicotianae P1569]